ncbi:hypothetical protein [Puniceibacterium confluentis]|uniref:hypothetical protein n=1 Tax=Puniceibacterium confluentis TaxID=1958944 RepID=UPI0011B5E814|nr:hypothetical protein [Puniceibacterium confluentis]
MEITLSSAVPMITVLAAVQGAADFLAVQATTVSGGEGDDVLIGSVGNASLNGGAGNETMTGGVSPIN